MCGLFGEFGEKQPLLDTASFMALNDLSKSRGPNSTGHYRLSHTIQLGFNRLAILDLTPAADQPFHTPSKRFSFVFNGEIYNHLDLRNQYFSHYQFKGLSDTETLAVAIDEMGIEQTVELCDGMFALVIYDHNHKECWLARDFAGIKPLHYGFRNGMLVFASQYDQIAKHPLFKSSDINREILNLYLQIQYIPAPFGILEDTHQVRPGEILHFGLDGMIKTKRYWELPVNGKNPICTDPDEGLRIIEDALSHSVRAELLSDVPLGTFLSGGIDSPLVTYFAQQHSSQTISSYSIGTDSKVHDESKDIEFYSKAIQVNCKLKRLTGYEISDYLSSAMLSLKEPFADHSIIPTYVVSQLASNELTVALSGDGGDELFFGYERFWSLLKNTPYLWIPHLFRYPVYGLSKVLEGNKHINECFLAKSISQAHLGLHSRGARPVYHSIFPDLKDLNLPEAFNIYEYPDLSDQSTMLGHTRHAEFYGMMQKTLFKVDRASMANSLEVRVPFLKKSVIESSLQLSPYLSYGPNKKKDLLKKLLRKKIPFSPIDNRKKGFSIPLRAWIEGPLFDLFRDKMKKIKYLGGNELNAVRLLDIHNRGTPQTDLLFSLFSLICWWEEWQK
ncbi:MAG: asparagine synthase (glutamine-hydrolyzing) [Acidobacteria bacterium]|nr:MAG: asparagine synthase (glutamine-hydrolyzing) [Acidobacteriota bacterium]